MKHFLLLLFAMSVGAFLLAQTTCQEKLKMAERYFDDGQLDEIPAMVEPCLKSGYTSEEKLNAYKLLIQTFLFNEKAELADVMMVEFLREFPEYEITRSDPREFINLHGTYRTEPIFKLDINGTLGYTFPTVLEYYGVEDLNTPNVTYTPLLGFVMGINYTRKFYHNCDGAFGLNLTYRRLGYTNQLYPHTSLSGTYSNFHVGIPLSVRYNLALWGIRAIASVGVETSYQLTSTISLTRSFTNGADPLTGNVNLIDYHNRFDFCPVLSIGSSIRFGKTEMLVFAGIKFGAVNQTKADRREVNREVIDKFYFIEDDLTINQVFLSFSYIISIYNPKKLR